MARLRTVKIKGFTRSAQSPPTKTPLSFAYEDKCFSYFGHIINIFYLYMESTYCGLQLFYDLLNYNVSCFQKSTDLIQDVLSKTFIEGGWRN